MMQLEETIDNRTLCDVFGVGNMGGIRVSNQRSLIVLVSNNTDQTYRNEWRNGVLHFVGRGSVGPQVLSHQNKTLANAKRHGWTVHLFEVFEKSRYTYAGEVELADEPYRSDQPDARANDRFVWIFPLRKKEFKSAAARVADCHGNRLPAPRRVCGDRRGRNRRATRARGRGSGQAQGSRRVGLRRPRR